MGRFTLIAGAWAIALGVVIVLFIRDWVPAVTPSRVECVSLWNAPGNAAHRRWVAKAGYPLAEINGAFSEDRYQGCYAIFADEVGDPWALFVATRIPGTGTRLEWKLDAQAEEWGVSFPPPKTRPRPNATVRPDGTAFLV